MAYLLVCGIGLLAGMLSGVIGTGSSMMLMPVLVILYGPNRLPCRSSWAMGS